MWPCLSFCLTTATPDRGIFPDTSGLYSLSGCPEQLSGLANTGKASVHLRPALGTGWWCVEAGREGMRSGHWPSAAEGLWSDPDRVLTHFDDMGADVVATHSARCCNPMMAVENVVLTVPSPHLDGRERLTLAHGDQYAAQAGVGSLTEWPEVPVEQLRCAVDRPHDAGDRDELFAAIPKLPVIVGGILQNGKARASTAA
jgi:hypothetical protein